MFTYTHIELINNKSDFKKMIYVFMLYIYEHTIAVFGHTRGGHHVPLPMVVGHHVVAGN